jgi:Xaa-Pro aminopeptidase
MRRGLMGWNPDELPLATLAERTARLQAAMQKDGLQALMIYTNLVRPSAVSYLTGLTPYWSEGLLLLGRDGEPAFATALSKRVANWIRSVSPVGEIVNTPRPGAVLGARIAAAGMTRVGILEFDAFPSGAYDDLVAAAPAAELVDATRLFAEARRGADSAEQRLLARADAIALAALGEVDPNGAPDAGSVAGLVEKHARLDGAEEAYIAVAPDLASDPRMIRAAPALPLGRSFAVRASIAYKGFWVRRTRSFASDVQWEAFGRADQWFAQRVRAIRPGRPLAEQIADQVRSLRGATLSSWMAESCVGSYPLQVIASSRSIGNAVNPGDFLVLTIALSLDGTPWLGAAPLIVGDSPQ